MKNPYPCHGHETTDYEEDRTSLPLCLGVKETKKKPAGGRTWPIPEGISRPRKGGKTGALQAGEEKFRCAAVVPQTNHWFKAQVKVAKGENAPTEPLKTDSETIIAYVRVEGW